MCLNCWAVAGLWIALRLEDWLLRWLVEVRCGEIAGRW